MSKIKFGEIAEDHADDFIQKTIKDKYKHNRTFQNEIMSENLKANMISHLILGEIEELAWGIIKWLAIIALLLCLILYKIW